jgi:hypothetical protein
LAVTTERKSYTGTPATRGEGGKTKDRGVLVGGEEGEGARTPGVNTETAGAKRATSREVRAAAAATEDEGKEKGAEAEGDTAVATRGRGTLN